MNLIFSHSSKENSINLVSKRFREIRFLSFFESQEFKNNLIEYGKIKQKYNLKVDIADISVFTQLTISEKIDTFIKIKKILKIEELCKSSTPLIFKETEGSLRPSTDDDKLYHKEYFADDFKIRFFLLDNLVFSKKFVGEACFHDIKNIINQFLQKTCAKSLAIESLQKIKDKQFTYLFPKLAFSVYMNEGGRPYAYSENCSEEGEIVKEISLKTSMNISFENAVKEIHSKILRSLKIKIHVTSPVIASNNSQQTRYFGDVAQHFSISIETLSLIKSYNEKLLKDTFHPFFDSTESLSNVAKIFSEAKDLLENQIVQIMIINHKKIHSTICLELFSPETFDHYVAAYKKEIEKKISEERKTRGECKEMDDSLRRLYQDALLLQSKDFNDFVNKLYQTAFEKKTTVSKCLSNVIRSHNILFTK